MNKKESSEQLNFTQILLDDEACDKITAQFEKDLPERMETLTDKEKQMFRMIRPQSGVLYIQGRPGIAKSAKANAIAAKLGMRYLDVRLAMVDETDVGLFPSKIAKEINGVMMEFLDHVVPIWAWEANRVPTLIHFEELNRASLPVRNAALQLLLERAIGTKFKFNKNVYMLTSGNLGDEDSTDVEEFDMALNNRLIHRKFDLSVDEWLQDFAKDNIHPDIISFIELHREQLYNKPTDDNPAYATPRSWTFLSDFIKINYGKWVNEKYIDGKEQKFRDVFEWGRASDYVKDIETISVSYIGSAGASKFVQFLMDRLAITINDIIDKYPKIQKDVVGSRRDRYSEWFHSLKAMDIDKMTAKQIGNLKLFLADAQAEERTSYFLEIVDNNDITKSVSKNIVELIQPFKKEIQKIFEISNSNN